VLKRLCRCSGHHSESFERLEWIPCFYADPLEKVVEYYRCNRCRFSWMEVIYDAQAIDAGLKQIEAEIEADIFR
jgi:hypothetical protein